MFNTIVYILIYMIIINTSNSFAGNKYTYPYNSINNIPYPLIEKAYPDMRIERYIANVLYPVRKNSADGKMLRPSDILRLREQMSANEIKSQVMYFLSYDLNFDRNVTSLEIKESFAKSGQKGNYAARLISELSRLNELDTDKNGVLSANEMKILPKKNGPSHLRMIDKNLEDYLNLDISGDDNIDVTELEKLARHAFSIMDKNSDGTVSKDELALQGARVEKQKRIRKCFFDNVIFPNNLEIYALSNVNKKPIFWGRDSDTAFGDVVINRPGKSVALLLGQSVKTDWQIRTTSGTKLVGIVVGGYEKQTFGKFTPPVPMIFNNDNNPDYDSDKFRSCGLFIVDEEPLNVVSLNSISMRAYGREITSVMSGTPGETLIIGDKNYDEAKLIGPMSSAGNQGLVSVSVGQLEIVDERGRKIVPEKIATTPLTPREAVIARDIKAGYIRPVTESDVDAWRRGLLAKMRNDPHYDVPPIVGAENKIEPELPIKNAYVVIKNNYIYPKDRIYGLNFATIVQKGVSFYADNVEIYDFNDYSCSGGRFGSSEYYYCKKPK